MTASNIDLRSELRFTVFDTAELILAARQLHAATFLDVGFVDQLDDDGLIEDTWPGRSTYVGVVDTAGRVLATTRLLFADDVRELPAIANFDIDPQHEPWIASVDARRVGYVAALAVDRKVNVALGNRIASTLYTGIASYSITDGGLDFWLASVDEFVLAHMTEAFDAQFERIGPARHYVGSMKAPIRVDLFEQIRYWSKVAPDRIEIFLPDIDIDTERRTVNGAQR